MNFDSVLRILKNGGRVARKNWKEKAYLQLNDLGDYKYCICFMSKNINICVWNPTQEDILSSDWYVLESE